MFIKEEVIQEFMISDYVFDGDGNISTIRFQGYINAIRFYDALLKIHKAFDLPVTPALEVFPVHSQYNAHLGYPDDPKEFITINHLTSLINSKEQPNRDIVKRNLFKMREAGWNCSEYNNYLCL